MKFVRKILNRIWGDKAAIASKSEPSSRTGVRLAVIALSSSGRWSASAVASSCVASATKSVGEMDNRSAIER